MADLGTLRVALVANLRKFVAGMKQGIANVKTFSSTVVSSMKRATRAISRFVLSAAKSLGAFAKKWVRRAIIALGALSIAAIKWAADAEESENLVRESFEGMTDAVIVWSERLQKELGLDAIQLRKQAGFFNLLTLSMGATEEQAFKVSTSLTELAADMASFRNQSFEEIFNAMRSGMVGMTRPLQNLGINIKENAVDQLLLARGIDRTAESLSEQERVLARYIAILEATKKDVGDLAHTYDSFTNVIRVMATNSKILTREMGDTMKKAITPLAIRMRDWLLNNREDVALWFEEVVDKFMDFTAFFTSGTWEQGLERGLELTLKLFAGFGEVVTTLFMDVFTNIGANIGVWMNRAIAVSLERRKLLQEQLISEGFSPTVARLTRGAAALGFATKAQLAELDKANEAIQKKLKKFQETTLLIAFPEAARSGDALDKLKEKWLEIGKAIKVAAKEGAKLRAEQDLIFAEEQAARDAKNAKLRAESKARLDAALADAEIEFMGLMQGTQALTDVMVEVTDRWADMWEDAASSIAGSMRTAWADMILQAKSGTEIIAALVQQMARSIIEASFTAFVQPGIMDIFGAIAGRGMTVQRSPATRNAQFLSGGGVVKPVYAATGFVAKGTDTVPAMLTPGEVVLPKEIVELIGNSGGSVTFNVNAIDAQNTAQWLNNNKRLIAGMVYDTSRGNNPASRRLGN